MTSPGLSLLFPHNTRVRPWDWVMVENILTPRIRLKGELVGIDHGDGSTVWFKLRGVKNEYDVRYWRVVEIVFAPKASVEYPFLSPGNLETFPP